MAWSPSTIATIVHQSAYSGVHSVKADDEYIEREVPPIIVEPGLQERAGAALEANRHRASAQRKGASKYLLSGLVTCGVCGYACAGHTSTRRDKTYSYYGCMSNRPELGTLSAQPHNAPRMSAPLLEELVWEDVKRFLENPGRSWSGSGHRSASDDATAELEERHRKLSRRLAAKSAEKDRYMRAYAQELISEEELAVYVTDLKNQASNLRRLVEAVEADLAAHDRERLAAESVEAWLMTLGERVSDVEENTPEAFHKRQQLVRLLVERITLNREGRETAAVITYRFGSPNERAGVGTSVVGNERNTEEFPKERKKLKLFAPFGAWWCR